MLPLDGKATLAVRCRPSHHRLIARELQAAYPDLRIEKRREPIEKSKRYRVCLALIPDTVSLRSYETFRNDVDGSFVDPVSSLLSAIAPGAAALDFRIEFQCRPCSTRRLKRFVQRCAAVDSEKGSHAMYRCRVTVSGTGRGNVPVVKRHLHEIAAVFQQFTTGTKTAFKRRPGWRSWFICHNGELATMWHPPTAVVKAAAVETNDSRSLEAPLSIGSGKESGGVVLGRHDAGGTWKNFGLQLNDRRRHCVIAGKTGQGKSTLLHQMIVSDINAGHGVAVLDPHGDLAESVLRWVPGSRSQDIVLLDAGAQDFPAAFNPLQCPPGTDRALLASGLVSALKKNFGDSWGPRLEYTLRAAVLAQLEAPDASFVGLMRMLTDARYRESLMGHVTDPLIRSFWLEEFANKPDRLQAETISPIQNKVGQFLSSPILRNIVAQVPGRINVRECMDQSKILIVNLSKGMIGEDSCSLLGSFLVAAIQQAAMSRSDTPEDERKDFFCYIDEFGSLSSESFATSFSELRKYRTNLICACQFIQQLDETTRHAVWGNVGNLLSFQVGIEDAELLAPQFAGDLQPLDLISLPQYHAYARILNQGVPTKPFTMKTIAPKDPRHEDRSDKLRRTSNRQYARPRDEVTKAIEKQLGSFG
ncbi:MAG: DUF87 domain-containing protein [Planctomycetota bacterium]